MIKSILIVVLLLSSSYAKSCWSRAELASFAQDEFNEKARFSVKDAVSCKAVVNAEFSIGKVSFKTDENGIITIPLPPQDMDREIPIRIKKDGYITSNEQLMVVFGSYWNNLFLITKDMPINSARFVLSWDNSPQDLDLHLKSDNYHISYQNTKSIKNMVKLNRDSQKGYGPETITVKKMDKNDTYKVLVHKYSRSGSINNKAQVRVFINNRLDRVVRLKNTTSECVQIATIKNNVVEYKLQELNELKCK